VSALDDPTSPDARKLSEERRNMAMTNTFGVVESLADKRDTSLEEVLDEIVVRGYPKHEAQAAFAGDLEAWNALFVGYFGRALGLVDEERHKLFYALMADAGTKASEARC
jgi:hypothetical protein